MKPPVQSRLLPALLLLVMGTADCARKGAQPAGARAQAAPAHHHHEARLAQLESLVTTLEARLQVLQAQARARGELARPGRQLTYEQWQPGTLERALAGGEAARGHGARAERRP